VLAALGGLWVPVEVFPQSMQGLAHAMPSYWYAQLGRDVAAGSAPSAGAVAALGAFAVGFAVLAVAVARRRPLYAVAG
jgi:ABC-2 type transport system permease protein